MEVEGWTGTERGGRKRRPGGQKDVRGAGGGGTEDHASPGRCSAVYACMPLIFLACFFLPFLKL